MKKILFYLLTLVLLNYSYAQPPTITSFSPTSGSVGSLVTITGTNLNNPTTLTIGGVAAIPISNIGTSLVAMVMTGSVTGNISIATGSGNVTSSTNFTVMASLPPNSQQGNKLVGTGAIGNGNQGYRTSISADGNTFIVGGYGDNGSIGAAWVYTRTGGSWTQQGSKLVGTGAVGQSQQGTSVSISADGNTAIVGGNKDNNDIGAAWVYTRTGGIWTQQGSKLVGTGAVGKSLQGISVSISADGNTAIIGGFRDDSNIGAAWVFTRSGGTWTQQGSKLVGTGAVGQSQQGTSLSISADGNTAIVGGSDDNNDIGAAWVFTRSGGIWSQQGSKLVGTGAVGQSQQGISVSISADGNTAIVGGISDNANSVSIGGSVGAAWVFTRSGGIWSQQGSKLVGTGAVNNAQQGRSVSISADGSTAIVGGHQDNSGRGAAWVYTRIGSTWTQQGNKLVGSGAVGGSYQGVSVSISANGNTAIVSGNGDNSSQGAAWVYTNAVAVPVTITNFKAFPKNSGIQVEWKTQNETNFDRYEVEKSTNGFNFNKAGTIVAKGLANYDWFDISPSKGDNFYRLKMIDKDNSYKYSSIVNVKIGSIKNIFTVVGNPIKNKIVELQMRNVEKGNYTISVYNNIGQQIMTKIIVHGGGSSTQSIYLDKVSKGTYQLNITGNNLRFTKTLLVE